MVVAQKIVKAVTSDNQKVVIMTTQIWYQVGGLCNWLSELMTLTTFRLTTTKLSVLTMF